MEERKEEVKKFYLVAIIAIAIIGIWLGYTFATFNTTASIDNPLTLTSNLISTSLLSETIDVIVPAGEEKDVDIVISNTYSSSLNYSVWYTSVSNDLEVGSESSSNSYGSSGSISSSDSFTLTVELRNNGTSSITVTIGVSSSGDSIVLPNDVTQVPGTSLS